MDQEISELINGLSMQVRDLRNRLEQTEELMKFTRRTVAGALAMAADILSDRIRTDPSGNPDQLYVPTTDSELPNLRAS